MANEITSANAASAIMKVVASQSMPALFGNLVMGNLVNRDFEPVLAQSGDQVNIALPPVMSANNVAEAGSVTNQNPSLGNANITLTTHAEATFQIPDVTKALVTPDLLNLYMQPAIIALAEKIETDLLATYSLFTANTALGGTSTMDEARIDSAETALFTAKVPASQPKYLVLAATSYGAARQIARFSEYQISGNPAAAAAAIASGEVGKLKNFLVFRSQYVTLATNYKNLAFTPNALGLITRRLPSPLPGTGAIAQYVEMGNFGFRIVMSYAPNTLAQQFTVDCLYGIGVLRNNHAVVVASN